jgi:hypothetical protein
MTTRQAGNMLHPGAQASAEHRRTPTGSPECPMSPSVSASRQSGLQSSAQSQHHLGASFSLAQPHCSDIVHVRPNNLKLVSTFRGEDQFLMQGSWEFRSATPPLIKLVEQN